MWPYWLTFISLGWLALTHVQPSQATTAQARPGRGAGYGLVFVLLALLLGLRHEIGADWHNYLLILEEAATQSLIEALSGSDPAYQVLNLASVRLGLGIHAVNTACAVIFLWGLLTFCRTQPRPWLALVVALPYLVLVVAMGYTRQGVAIGIAMMGLAALQQGRLGQFLLWIALASTFHKSAVILMPLALIVPGRGRLAPVLAVVAIAAALFQWLVADHLQALLRDYLEAGYESRGALVRALMNALPAAWLLQRRQRLGFTPNEARLWTGMALAALGLLVLLALSPSSTAVDRLSLYLIPLQMVALSRLPDSFISFSRQRAVVILVTLYSAATLGVWLFLADHAYAWVPYKFYPWVWLGS